MTLEAESQRLLRMMEEVRASIYVVIKIKYRLLPVDHPFRPDIYEGGFSVTRDSAKIISVTRDKSQIRRGMRDWTWQHDA